LGHSPRSDRCFPMAGSRPEADVAGMRPGFRPPPNTPSIAGRATFKLTFSSVPDTAQPYSRKSERRLPPSYILRRSRPQADIIRTHHLESSASNTISADRRMRRSLLSFRRRDAGRSGDRKTGHARQASPSWLEERP
jgi:hypothetical protein